MIREDVALSLAGRAAVGGFRVVECSMVEFFLGRKAAADRSVRTPASFSAPSTSQHDGEAEEHGQVRVVVTEHPVDQLAAAANNLTGNLDQGVEKSAKLHPQHAGACANFCVRRGGVRYLLIGSGIRPS